MKSRYAFAGSDLLVRPAVVSIRTNGREHGAYTVFLHASVRDDHKSVPAFVTTRGVHSIVCCVRLLKAERA